MYFNVNVTRTNVTLELIQINVTEQINTTNSEINMQSSYDTDIILEVYNMIKDLGLAPVHPLTSPSFVTHFICLHHRQDCTGRCIHASCVKTFPALFFF